MVLVGLNGSDEPVVHEHFSVGELRRRPVQDAEGGIVDGRVRVAHASTLTVCGDVVSLTRAEPAPSRRHPVALRFAEAARVRLR